MSFNPVELWNTMTPLAKGVAILLILMSIYSLTVAVERFIYYNKAKKQSLAFAKLVTGYLKQDKLQEAIDSSKRYKNSHLARVVAAGLYEFQLDIVSGSGTSSSGAAPASSSVFGPRRKQENRPCRWEAEAAATNFRATSTSRRWWTSASSC